KWRETCWKLTAVVMIYEVLLPSALRMGEEELQESSSLLPLDRDIVLGPLRVGDTGALVLAFADGRAPEPNLVEVLVAIGIAAGVGQQLVALAGGGNGGNRAKPGGDIALHLGLK